MDELINLAIYLIVGLVWLISVLGGKRKRHRLPEEEEFPFPFPLPQPAPTEVEEKEEPLPPPPQIEIEIPTTIVPPIVEEIEKPSPSLSYKEIEERAIEFSKERLEEGIILSTVLGPPKGYKYFRR